MKNSINLLLHLRVYRILIWLVFSLSLTGMFPDGLKAKEIIKDSSTVNVRTIDFSKLQEYREQKEFMYELQKGKGMSAWDRIRYWFWENYNRLMERPGFRIGFRVMVWVLSIGIMLYAVLRIVGMDKVMLWMKKEDKGLQAFHAENDSIYGVDFDQQIAQFVQEKNFRAAIRLLYLKSLRSLSDRNLIHWSLNKTNFDYAQELESTRFGPGFDQITRYYEFAWYGEFDVSEEEYRRIFPLFHQFDQSLKG